MKKLLNILMIAMIYLSFCGKSCVDENEQTAWQTRQVEMAKDTIREEFESDYLSEEARQAAEVNAMQKLKDLADYMEIYADQSLDSAFRNKAGEMIRDLFESENSRVFLGQINNDKLIYLSVKEFLKEGFGAGIDRVEISFDSVRVADPLHKSGEYLYAGKLIAYQTVIKNQEKDSIISPARSTMIDFISRKQLKIIGKDTLAVWETFLGNME